MISLPGVEESRSAPGSAWGGSFTDPQTLSEVASGPVMKPKHWKDCTDPVLMMSILRQRLGSSHKKRRQRKFTLFNCACLRDRWAAMTDPRLRTAVEFLEKDADQKEKTKHLERILNDATQAYYDLLRERQLEHYYEDVVGHPEDMNCEFTAANFLGVYRVGGPFAELNWIERIRYSDRQPPNDPAAWEARQLLLCDYLRDIFGNPYLHGTFQKKWRTEHTVGLSAQMYETRNYVAMPFLADALEEAGCNNSEILKHCRGEGVHVRGCWVIDLILGKE
jgi:hypothetical protein